MFVESIFLCNANEIRLVDAQISDDSYRPMYLGRSRVTDITNMYFFLSGIFS